MSRKDTSLKTIINKLESALDEDRFFHTLGVASCAQLLARIHDENPEKAYLAGLLHDCAKNVSHKDKIKLCEKNNVDMTEAELANPTLLHAKCGAILARKEYHIEDEEILLAISSHTTGRPEMSKLEQIIFIADYIEAGRESRPNLNDLRKLSFEDLDKCTCRILQDTLEFLSDSAKAIDPMTAETYKYYSNLIRG